MKFHGITMYGNFVCQTVTNIGALGTAGTKGRVVYVESENSIYIDTGTEWKVTGLDPKLFDANTILTAVTDNIPSATTIGEQTVVGRLTGGAIKALSTAELTTLVSPATSAAKGSIILATNSEVVTGTDTEKAVTPAALAARMSTSLPLTASSLTVTSLSATSLTSTSVTASSLTTTAITASTLTLTTSPSAEAIMVSNATGLGSWQPFKFARGGTVVNTVDYVPAINVVAWYATFACRVTNVRGFRVGGGATTSINARKNGSSNHLATAKTLAAESTWYDAGAVQNIDYAIGDMLEIMVVVPGASLTQIAIQVDFIKI